MDFYPSEFPLEARDRVEKEKILAYRDLLPSNVYDSRKQDLAIQCIMRIFLAFAKEAFVLRNEIGWSIDRIQQESNEFRRRLTIMVVHEKFPGLDRQWISNWDGSIESGVERLFKASAEWKQYEELLLAVPVKAGKSEPNTMAEHLEISPAANSVKTVQDVESSPTEAESWTEIEIAFLSDERVEICGIGNRRNYNYSELAFEDRRNGRPNRAWVTLREMATRNGSMTIPPTTAGKELAMIQKRIEEIRENLRSHFKIKADPIPFSGNTYQTSFKLSCRPSFNT